MMKYAGAGLAILTVVLISTQAEALTCTGYTNTLTNGTTTNADRVMENFGDILTCVNLNVAALGGAQFTGSVGIGAAPQNLLTLADGGSPYSGGTHRFLQLFTNSTGAVELGLGNTNNMFAVRATLGTGGANQRIGFVDGGGTERLIVTGQGNVGIGTTSPGQVLHVVGTIRQTNCTTAGTLSANTSGDIICTSDARLKNVLGAYTGGLEVLDRVDPKLFTYKTTPNNPVETFVHAGFIAQNVMAIIPQAVALQRDGYYSLDTTPILAASVNAIKQLKAERDRQAAEIAAMKARLAANEQALAASGREQAAAIRELRAEVASLRHGTRTAAR